LTIRPGPASQRTAIGLRVIAGILCRAENRLPEPRTNGDRKPEATSVGIRARLADLSLLEGLVAIAALFVSVSALIVSCRATEISNRQAKVAEAELEPVISATATYTSHRDAEKMTVRNVGGPADSFDIDYVVLLSIDYASTPNKSPIERVVPLEDYYGVSYSTGAPTGELAEISDPTPPNNNNAFGRLVQATQEYSKQQSASLYVDVVRFLRVKYVNRLGEQHTRYLTVDILHGSKQVSAAAGKRAFDIETELSAQSVPLHSATPPDVVAAWQEGAAPPTVR